MLKAIALFFLLTTALLSKAQYEAHKISLYASWNNPLETALISSAKYNSVWGFVQKGREYAVLGGTSGTYIIDVTTPDTPALKDFVPGRRNLTTWREYKTYRNYLYMVSDDAPPNSLQIADLSYLPDSVHLVHDSDTIIRTAHTIYIDGDKLYAAIPKTATSSYSMAVYSLSNPEKPLLLRGLNQDYPDISIVHDMFVRNDTVYASCGNQGLYVFKFEQDTTFRLIGSLTQYNQQGYNHSSWLTDNGKTLVFCDEVPANLAVKSVDVTDLTDITVKALFKSQGGPTPHNPYIIGNTHAVIAYYQDGVQIFNISDPTNPRKTGFFDTHPQNGNTYNVSEAYNGCWGAYPFLPSGILLASDRQNGLFILNPDSALGRIPEAPIPLNPPIGIHPNPFIDKITVNLEEPLNGNVLIELHDMLGKKVFSETITAIGTSPFIATLNINNFLSNHLYIITVKSGSFYKKRKLFHYSE